MKRVKDYQKQGGVKTVCRSVRLHLSADNYHLEQCARRVPLAARSGV